MSVATLAGEQLPAPLSNRTGWPWTVNVEPVSKELPNEGSWPKISIVTPSYNQADFLEETIRSVLSQRIPNLEYIIIDGGSTDGSIDIIRHYEKHLAYWVSEPDRGQCHAINKGLERATGDIVAWLNSDDTYLPGAIEKAAGALTLQPAVGFVYGSAVFVDETGKKLNNYTAQPLGPGLARMKYWHGWPVPQPALFVRRNVLDRYGLLDESFHYGLDYEWIIRISQQELFECLPDTLATYRLHSSSKTSHWNDTRHLFFAETRRANYKYAPPYQMRNWSLWMDDTLYRLRIAAGRLKMWGRKKLQSGTSR
jgi:glycosyltransferase involved in cell wall biosynthesis